jgi:hypothetical protein
MPECSRCFERWQQLVTDHGIAPDREALAATDRRTEEADRRLADVMDEILTFDGPDT